MGNQWETVEDYTFRLRVYGGWLVRYDNDIVHNHLDRGMIGGWDWRSTMVFVPDPEHKWAKWVVGKE